MLQDRKKEKPEASVIASFRLFLYQVSASVLS